MMFTTDQGGAEVSVGFEIHWQVILDPGVWVTAHRGETVSITTVYGTRRDDTYHVAFPKGVSRRAGGIWSLRERILADILPDDSIQAWSQIPDQVRSAIEDAYLLARYDLPEQVGPA